MKFRTQRPIEPEINLIAFIDVLLVILIFLMLSSTYNKYTEVHLNLPTADTKVQAENAQEILVSITSDGQYAVNKQPLAQRGVKGLTLALSQAGSGLDKPMLVISADALAPHQSVISVMEAGKAAGIQAITFVTRAPQTGAAR
ncbi:MAG: biopolymer transporter ExbD [Betaproteobacteria bacterium]|jgi:biopolymer transport protein ExbD|nr:biopolymer transporter ExbD [Betaproteobacteria bacterium]